MSNEPVLSISDLTITIDRRPVVDGLSLEIMPGECLALVGESGCGKTLTSLSVIGLLPSAATIESGSIRIKGQELTGLDEAAFRKMRGQLVSMIFQEPVLSLNPLMRVGDQVAEALEVHGGLSKSQAMDRAIAMLEAVGISNPARRAYQFPFELSGGMCQRVMIAMALIHNPPLLIADEPTTALDVTIQAQILDLIQQMRSETSTSVLLITHDMGVVAETADRIAVMYAGQIVETAVINALFEKQWHPYTGLLLQTIPKLDGRRKSALPAISGSVPDIRDWPAGCRFSTRCPLVDDRCRNEVPDLAPVPGASDRAAACWHRDRVEELL